MSKVYSLNFEISDINMTIGVLLTLLFCALATGTRIGNGTNPCGFIKYGQCDSHWARNPLGTSTSETICSAGCAMTSVSMLMATKGYEINNEPINPGTLL
eukprot:TRINITY_DN336_c0_g1_i3.p1 TRINITY_DN336_c0_g1~~TRINITY_DN336_c0_g1_i3.p1  ORF type:complete len:100 (-),score=9.98 TRINITY_DN336_c0_g1_i3:158-457(-)